MSKSWASVAIQYHLTEHGLLHWEDYRTRSYRTSTPKAKPARLMTFGTTNEVSASEPWSS